MARFQTPVDQFFDDSGDPLIDGKLIFKSSGTNTDMKPCKKCHNPNMVLLTSQNARWCFVCEVWYDWSLGKDQKGVYQ